MKKNLFFVALAAVALVSCSSNDEVEEIAEAQSPISFDEVLNNTTRAEIADKAALATAGGFAVYGSKTASSTTTTIFTNENVKSTDSGTSWTYTNTKYWDKTATYAFYAVAPYESTPNYSISNGKFTIDNVASGLASASKDYIIDRDGATGINGKTYAEASTKVGFDFHHTMAKVDFKLAKATGITGTLKVKKITMTGWNSGVGKFVQTLTATPTTLDKSEWTIGTAGTGSVDILSSDDGVEVNTTAATCSTNTYIMVPQEIAADALTFTIDYVLGDEPFTAQVGKISTLQTWGTDSHTTYTLTIGPSAIQFDVTSVCDFCAPSGGNNQSGTIN